MIVDLSDYNRYLNQIWYRTQIPHCKHAGMAKFFGLDKDIKFCVCDILHQIIWEVNSRDVIK